MPNTGDLFTKRKSLDEICVIPNKIISVYSLEKHVWANSNSEESRKIRKPELQTIEEFQIDPVRPFLTDILRNMAAPYKPDHKDNPIGQGYWIQAEFGSGKSHLLCFLAALTMGNKDAWEIIQRKEEKARRGKRESLYLFWQEGLEAKGSKGKKGIFVIVRTLVGAGGGTIGLTDKGQRLSEYIIDAAKEQIQIELGKNLSLYPTELLADRFLSEDLDRYRKDLQKFLRDPRFFEEDEFEEVDNFLRDIQQNKSPEYKRSCGNKLWRFYTEYLKVQPQIAAETEDILKHMVKVILDEGYSGLILVLDEVSLFMKNRDEDQRTDDEKTLVVLSNRLAKVHNLPVWTVCAAQQAIESKMGIKNIIADDRLKLVKLLEEDKGYYDIVLSRVREIKNIGAISNYYIYYKRGFTWPNNIGEKEFGHFFPFHKPAIEVLRAITYELTTTRSAIHFMHQTLKHQIKNKGCELIRLWELFDEAIRYEEDPSGVHAGLVAIKTKREVDYKAYESCKRQIDGLTKGALKVHRDKAIKIIQTLFLYYIAKTRQHGITSEEIANSVLIERDSDANPDENIQHYETLAENLRKELRQIAQNFDEDNRPRYRFDPVFTGVDPRDEFRKARDEAESNELMVKESWDHLLVLDEWPIRTRQMTYDLSNGVRSIFRNIAKNDQKIEIIWQGREITGNIGMRDLARLVSENKPLPAINSDETDQDFAVFIGTRPVPQEVINKLLSNQRKDPRFILWTPGELTTEEHDRLLDFAAYRKLISDWQGKDTEDALSVINWVYNSLQVDLAKIIKVVNNSYARGRIDSLNNLQMDFHVAGELGNIITPIVDRVLIAAYESRDIRFEPPFRFRKEEGVKVINGIVKTGLIPKNAKPNQNTSAAQNFGFGLKIIKRGIEKMLDISENPYVHDIWNFIDGKLTESGQTMKTETLYKNFMGIGGPKDYGMSSIIIQIFLLCLVKQGKIRIGIGPKSGLSYSSIDYSNIADIDFSTKILDSCTEVQKLAKPENWEALRPYAEKILGESIRSTHDDSEISQYRTKLREKFTREKEESVRIQSKIKGLFETLNVCNPYEKELGQFVKLYSVDIQSSNDIDTILYALKDAFGYNAFDSGVTSQTEIDDLSNRLKNYYDSKHFLEYETELRAIHVYCNHVLPDLPDLKRVRKIQHILSEKLTSLKIYIDSDVKFKTELVGRIPPDTNEKGTLGALIKEYTTLYIALHDSLLDSAEKGRKEIQDILNGDELKAFKILEKVSAIQPPASDRVERELNDLMDDILICPSPSKTSIEDQLKSKPIHECGLYFQNADEYLHSLESKVEQAKVLFYSAFHTKLEVFMNPIIRDRLKQGKSEPVVSNLIKANNLTEIREYLVKACGEDPSIVDVINRYLKRISIKRVKIADFKPSINTIEKDQISVVSREFQKFLEQQLKNTNAGDETLSMIQLE